MEFRISQESNLEGQKASIVLQLSVALNTYFASRNYGNSIKSYLIGLICVKPEFETFFKIRKPKYLESETIKSLDGSNMEIENVYGYDVAVDYNAFVNVSDDESWKLLAREIEESLSNLDKLPMKIKDFDKKRFKSDLKIFFKQKRKF